MSKQVGAEHGRLAVSNQQVYLLGAQVPQLLGERDERAALAHEVVDDQRLPTR